MAPADTEQEAIMRIAGRTWLAAALVAGWAMTACTGADDAADTDTSASEDTQPAAEQGAPTLNDAEIAAIVVAANAIDVRYGEVARERANDERVRQFAETMITDHTAVNQSAGELVARLGVTPQENDVSRSLEASAEDTRASLMAMSGAEFDRAYIANEVEYHRAVLDALDNLLIPNATNAELKSTLEGVRPAFQAHLQHAESIQQSLGGT
jgi:putative membrane protein